MKLSTRVLLVFKARTEYNEVLDFVRYSVRSNKSRKNVSKCLFFHVFCALFLKRVLFSASGKLKRVFKVCTARRP